ncbi:MAG: rane protein required for colicin production [Paraburkholderia sp.]|jgi:membrane protein required for colicin V production|nr:rane protein required for colicin production [Paraburkholderia sp.]MEA3122953.1 rane protein required for colicin production [Paraburkholderia sp.]
MLTAFDYAALAVIALSALRGAWRGLLSEVFGLIGWIVAFFVASRYVDRLVPYIPADWPGGALTQWLLAFMGIAVGVVLVAGIGSAVIARLVAASGLDGADRSLGLMFGIVRGVLVVLVLVALAGLTELPKQEFWRHALLRPYAEQGVRTLKPFLPKALAEYVRI